MKAESLTVTGVFQNDRILSIPYFQRNYVWGEEQWKTFMDSMESITVNRKMYFLGSLIFKEKDVTVNESNMGIHQKFGVIDGQQRITTVCIYMKLLHMLTLKSANFDFRFLLDTPLKDPQLQHCHEDRVEFEKVMHLDVPSAEIRGCQSNVHEAYKYFYRELMKKTPAERLDLLNTFFAFVNFVVITLDSKDNEQQIFDTINSLGVDLTTDELLKNFLYEEQDEQAYKQNWNPMFDRIASRKFWGTDAASYKQSKKKDSKLIERFFHAFVRIKMWDLQLTENQKKSYVKIENLFQTCKEFCLVHNVGKQQLANEIIAYAKLFRENFAPDVLDVRIPQAACMKRISCIVNARKAWSVVPYVLYVLMNQPDEQERNKIFSYLESYLIRRIICHTNDNSYSDLFSENLINSGIVTADDFIEYIQKKDPTKNLAMPDDMKMKICINTTKMDEGTARLIYYLYETSIHGVTDFIDGYNKYQTEQIMPKAPNTVWPAEQDPVAEENRLLLSQTLGNWVLLYDVANEKAVGKVRALNLSSKKSALEPLTKDKVQTTYQLLSTIQTWDASAVSVRNAAMADRFNQYIWKA